MEINWDLKQFSELSPIELYELLKLRQDTFIIEQDCIYPDIDNKDFKAYHLLGRDQSGKVIAYSRIFNAGAYFDAVSIGRVVVDQDSRGNQVGRKLMEKSITLALDLFNTDQIMISAQYYLLNFYKSLEFQALGEPYLEDDIPHIRMVYRRS